MMTENNRENSLFYIAEAGKMVKQMAESTHWRYEDRHRAEYFVPLVPALRECYWMVKHAETKVEAKNAILKAMSIVRTGIELNCLARALAYVQAQ